MPGRNLNLVDVLTALGQGVIEDIPADPNEVVNNLLSDCEHVGMHGTWCCKGVRLIGGPFLWDSALWNYANWDGAFNQFVAVPQPGYVNSVLTDRPYAYYRLDENFTCFGSKVIDSSGGVHDGVSSGSITYNVPGALAGDPDTAMSFNTTGTVGIPNFVGWAFLPSNAGSTGYDSVILYDSHLVYDGTGTANQTTVELWINLASLPTANVTAFGVTSAYSLQVTPSGHISLGNESGGTITSTGALVVGTYSHIVGIINASSSTLYINGNPDVSGAVSIPTGTSAGTAHIAAGGAKYGVVVSADTPKAYWRMDDTGSTLVDASGDGNSGTITGGVTRSVTGLTADGDTAMSFNGSTGWVDVPYTSSLNFTTAVSVECLIKPNVLQTGIIAAQDFGNPDNTDYRWQLNIQLDGSQWIIQWQIVVNGTAQSVWSAVGNVFLTSGSTYHVVGTWDGATMNLYMNGVSMGPAPLSGSLNLTNKHINIGQNSLFGDFYSGVLDELAVYSTALSASRVASHYGAVSGTQVPGLNATVDEVAIYDKTLTTARIQAHYNARAVQVGKAGENTKISTSYSAITLPVLSWTSTYALTIPVATPVAWWRMDDASGVTLTDISGHGHNAAISATGVTYNVAGATGDGDTAMSFNGSTGVITVANLSSTITGGSISLECWAWLPNKPTGHSAVCGFRNGDTSDCDFYILQIAGTNTIEFRLRNSPSAAISGDFVSTPGRWHYFALVYDNLGQILNLYQDGLFAAGLPCSIGPITDATSPFAIGANVQTSGTVNYSSARVDDVALYSYALSPTQISSHYLAAFANLWAGGGGSRNAWG